MMKNKTLLERFTELANSRKAEIVELQHMYLLNRLKMKSFRSDLRKYIIRF